MECVVSFIAAYDDSSQPFLQTLFAQAIEHLAQGNNYRWMHHAWFLAGAPAFFAALSDTLSNTVLDSLLGCPRLGHEGERILSCIAKVNPQGVLQFFGKRIAVRRSENFEGSYEAIPHQFHGFEKELSQNVGIAVDTVRGWFLVDDSWFEFGGAQLLCVIFPQFPRAAKSQTSGHDGEWLAGRYRLRNYGPSAVQWRTCDPRRYGTYNRNVASR
jgi:hypothetical protein